MILACILESLQQNPTVMLWPTVLFIHTSEKAEPEWKGKQQYLHQCAYSDVSPGHYVLQQTTKSEFPATEYRDDVLEVV